MTIDECRVSMQAAFEAQGYVVIGSDHTLVIGAVLTATRFGDEEFDCMMRIVLESSFEEWLTQIENHAANTMEYVNQNLEYYRSHHYYRVVAE